MSGTPTPKCAECDGTGRDKEHPGIYRCMACGGMGRPTNPIGTPTGRTPASMLVRFPKIRALPYRVSRYRPDGWPICPHCDCDELYCFGSRGIQDIVGCNNCGHCDVSAVPSEPAHDAAVMYANRYPDPDPRAPTPGSTTGPTYETLAAQLDDVSDGIAILQADLAAALKREGEARDMLGQLRTELAIKTTAHLDALEMANNFSRNVDTAQRDAREARERAARLEKLLRDGWQLAALLRHAAGIQGTPPPDHLLVPLIRLFNWDTELANNDDLTAPVPTAEAAKEPT